MPKVNDLTGKRFGSLIVVGKGDRVTTGSEKGRPTWRLLCDCGNTVDRVGSKLTAKKKGLRCCGYTCPLNPQIHPDQKPDCTGRRFGMLVVIGRGSSVDTPRKDRKSPGKRRLWKLRCDCGNIVELPRSYFEGKGMKSCGCLGKNRKGRVDNKQVPEDLAGIRFGLLVVTRMLSMSERGGKPPLSECQCDCGNTVVYQSDRLKASLRNKVSYLNCRDPEKHAGEFGIWYPPTPTPYPEEAGKLLKKYLKFTQYADRDDRGFDIAGVRDEKFERLLRAAWIIVCRRRQGEEISEQYEKRFILKHLRYASIDVARKTSTIDRKSNQIGGKTAMATNQETLTVQTIIETLPDIILPAPRKPKKFKRR